MPVPRADHPRCCVGASCALGLISVVTFICAMGTCMKPLGAREHRVWICAGVAIAVLVCPLRSWSQTAPFHFPTKEEGYEITRCCETNEKNGKAPDGYEGRTETSTVKAVGNTPATMGKTFGAASG